MKNILNFIFLSIIVFVLSCNMDPTDKVFGTIENGEDLNVYFDRIQPDGTSMVLQSGTADSKGDFSFQFPEGLEAGAYRVRIGSKDIQFLHTGNGAKIELYGKLDDLHKFEYEIKGSPISIQYRDIIKDVMAGNIRPNEMIKMIEGIDEPWLAAMLAIKTLNVQTPIYLSTHEKIYKDLAAKYPDSEFTKRYFMILNNMQKQLSASSRNKSKFNIGDVAPEIALQNPEGKVMKLSDLKGQIVLLDFWASWCGPCRKANPHVVEIYKKYKNQGFTVYSVSLDGLDTRSKSRYKTEEQIENAMLASKQRWLDAINKDQLEWEYHVSDLKKWESKAASLYGVRSIPQTFLIDREGKIAAVNPRYTLEEDLKRLL